MNLLFSCIGKRGYIVDFFRPYLSRGDRIIGTSNTKWTPGFEHCDFNYVLPDIDCPEYISKVKEICQRESIDAILSFFDPDVVKLASHFDEFLAMGVQPVMPRQHIAEICFDKYQTFKFFTENGFLTPKTYLNYEEVMDLLMDGSLDYPLYVKPRNGFGSALTFKAHNEPEVNAFFHYAADMIIQEEMTGEAVDFDILNDLEGNVLSVVPWKKYRSKMGETEQAETFYDQNILNFGIELGSSLKHIGPLDADLFVNGSVISVLEVNLRFGGGYPVSHLAGANFPVKIIRMLKGEKMSPDIGQFEVGSVMMKDNLIIGGASDEFFASKFEEKI